MKRRLVWPMLALCVLLTACGGRHFDPQTVRDHYADGGQLTARYTVTTHGSFFTEYVLDAAMEGGLMTVTIREPQSVAGVSAVLQNGRAELQYEDVSLDALLPELTGFSPMDSLLGLLTDLSTRLPESWASEEDVLVLDYRQTLSDGQESLKRVELEREMLSLRRAELYLQDDLLLALECDDFCWTPAG